MIKIAALREKLALAVQSPKYARNQLRDRIFGLNCASFPSDITLFLTDRCNFACKMCAYGDARADRQSEVRADMPLELVAKISAEASRYGAFIELFGGEPLLHREIIEAVRIASRKNLISVVSTNGLLLPRLARVLVQSGARVVRISLDGWDDESQRERGKVAGSFRAIMDGIRELAAAKRTAVFPSVRVVTAITKVNFSSLHRIQAALHAVGVRHWTILNYQFITKAAVEAHDRFGFGDHFIGDPIGSGGYLDGEEISALRRSLGQVKTNLRTTMRDMQVYYPWHVDIDRYYSELPPSPQSVCTMPLYRVDVHRDGRIALCGDGFTIGNLHGESLKSAWTGDRMKAFRKVWSEPRASFPMCFRCCGIANTISFAGCEQPIREGQLEPERAA
ncbi:MAG: radical SAM protein [Terriglobales bacterium]